MEFKRFGKSFQMVINNGCDLEEALGLDESLWVALSAPVNVFRCDPVLLKFLAKEDPKRITSKDLKTAIKWMLDLLPNHEAITREFDGKLKLSDITKDSDTGKKVIDSAQWIIRELQPEDKNTISIEQVRKFIATVTSRALNGDGVLTPKAAQEASTDAFKAQVAELIGYVVTATGGATDVDGTQGLDPKTMADFLANVPKYLEWYDKGQIPEGKTTTEIMTLGADTPALSALTKTYADKVDQFFKICKLLAFDNRLAPKALSTENKIAEFDPAVKAAIDTYEASLPIASPQPDRIFPLDVEKINPAYHAWFNSMIEKVFKPIIGENIEGITEDDWNKIKATFAPYEAYLASKAGACVEKIPVDALRKYLDCKPLIEEVSKLSDIDKDVANKVAAGKVLEELLLYRTYMVQFVNNFISFTDLYSPDRHALFECGKLVIDGRWFAVSFKVDAVGPHQAVAKNSQMFLMYLDVIKPTGEKFNVVVPVTSGDKGNLMVTKRGIFYDNDGNACDATVTQIQENPVCIKEAIKAPITRLWSIVEGKISDWSGSAEKNLQGNFTKAITPTPGAAPAPAPAAAPAPAPKDGKFNSNAFMGIGIAAAAIGSSLAFITKTLSGMTGFQIWMTVLVAILALILPVSIIAIIKLSRQDLSSIMEGCGWGINMRVRLDRKLRNQFTYFGKYPKGAKGTPTAYFFKVIVLVIIIIVAGVFGYRKWQEMKAADEAEKARIEQAEKEKAEAAKAVKEAANAVKDAANAAAAAQAAPAPAPAPAPAN